MDIGIIMAIFLIVATLLMTLFCILTKYYSYRLTIQRTTLQSICQLQRECSKSNQELEGAYEQFKQRQKQINYQQQNHSIEDKDTFIERTKINQILDISNNIYGLSSLRKRLDTDTIPLASQTHRSMSLKQFNITKIATQRQQSHYKYIKKLISYDIQELKIIQIKAKSIKKVNGGYQLLKMVQDYCVSQDSDNFLDLLDTHGFCYGDYGYYKYVHHIDTTGLKENQSRQIRNLQSNTSKQLIKSLQYNQEREIMLLSL